MDLIIDFSSPGPTIKLLCLDFEHLLSQIHNWKIHNENPKPPGKYASPMDGMGYGCFQE